MNSDTDLSSLNVTIMGLGLHGGGLSSAIFFAERGSKLTVTDLRNENILKPIIKKLKKYKIKYVLGEHRDIDFLNADLVIKNPAVPLSSPFLKLAKQIETDISIFLKFNKRPIIAVTGSKGKSTTVSAIFDVLKKVKKDSKLGGNITTSPLNFIDECKNKDGAEVILELSSWQLADLKDKKLLVPGISVITNIMPDHQNRYLSMDDYIADKKLIYADQKDDDFLICNFDDKYGKIFASEFPGRVLFVSEKILPSFTDGAFIDDFQGYIRLNGKEEKVLPENLKIPGEHNRLNLLYAALVLKLSGISTSEISEGLKQFSGISHRMELVALIKDISWYNDSAATIPQATAAAMRGCRTPFRLIAGGTDKKLDFDGTIEAFSLAKSIYLLEGSATDRLIILLKNQNISYNGPYDNLEVAVKRAAADTNPGESVIFSPGATSFGMFLNEFDRGDKFRQIVLDLP
ncbi:MAG: UDP-N-acetylmuramoyl-L-alanine--D-glutamate ligase [Spirochaetia bacterium]|nr:UDP-N-acetylmuramoyl-L-alanine--D-glutamate ligase [Spirochaetia bacterium]